MISSGAQVRVEVRRVAGQAVELGEGDGALAARPGDADDRLQRGQRHAHVRRVGGDAVLARAQDRVHAVEAVDRGTAGPRLALVAGRGRVVEVGAARPLHQVAARRRHVAELRRGARQDGLRQQRVAPLDLRVVGDVRVRHERAESAARRPSAGRISARGRRLMSISRLGPLDVLLHQVEQVRAAGDELGRAVRGDLAHGGRHVAGPGVGEGVHRPALLSPAVHRLLDRGDDVRVGAAPADVAAHQLADVVGRLRPALARSGRRRSRSGPACSSRTGRRRARRTPAAAGAARPPRRAPRSS